MIDLEASFQRTYLFPANLTSSFAYFSNSGRILNYLPHISIIHTYQPNQYRVNYHATEMGIYRILVICDLQISSDEVKNILTVRPLKNQPPRVQSSVGLYSLTGQGQYSSTSIFHPHGDQTLIDFSLQLEASLPVPYGLKLMPESLLSTLASEITQWRIREIGEGFMQRATLAYSKK
jgi:hypothetical protein